MKIKRKNSFFSGGGPRNFLIISLMLIGTLFFLVKLTERTRQITHLPYSTFLDKVEQKAVQQVHISGQEIYGKLKDGTRFETVIAKNNPSDLEVLRKHKVEFSIEDEMAQTNYWYFFVMLSVGFSILLGAWFFMRQSRSSGGNGGGANIFSMGRSKAKMFLPSTIKDNFKSVAGAHEAKEELQDVIDFLKNPEKYKRLGAKLTKGVLLVGAPGNGKTLLARAVAGEANCPFFSISGSDFIEVFVGVGAARVRDLFIQARKYAPAIIFIDEIDAVGRQRGSGLGGGHDEREQTLNQLLTEMDGFQEHENSVIIIAATNRPDVLDKALLRPGRFDRQVTVPYPDLICREEILNVHAKGVKLDSEVNMHKIARGTPGFSGADLANLINEAAIIASKNNQPSINLENFEEARDKVLVGKASKTIRMSDYERKVTAYHESGHALVRVLLPQDCEPLHKLTIIPRGSALGLTWSLPEEEKYMQSKEEIIGETTSALGGRAAEELVFNKLTTGAGNDFEKATTWVRNMVCYYGMSPAVGSAVYSQGYNSYNYSQKTAELIDSEVQRILDECYERAKKLLIENRDKLDALAQAVFEKETLQAAEVYELLGIEPREDQRFIKAE